ncbi:MAG TPA: hypothetical protein VL242_25835, partial [Sorangium sp.]|nr:hypothetical protein [Sorangium sp.]
AKILITSRAEVRPPLREVRSANQIFATTDDADFWWLLHPSIDRPITRSAMARGTAARDALFRLREALDADQNTARSARVESSPGSDWTVRQIRIRTS